jgi:hypothetical protein
MRCGNCTRTPIAINIGKQLMTATATFHQNAAIMVTAIVVEAKRPTDA